MRLNLLAVVAFIAPITAQADPIPNEMVLVPAGTFIMGDGEASCGEDERNVILTRSFYLGQHEVTNQEYMEAVQWAYDQGHVTATIESVRDNLDGSTEELLVLDSEFSEIQFDAVTYTFYLRQSPSSYAQDAYPGGYEPADHPVKEVNWYGSARYCDWLSMQVELPRAYEHTGDWSCNGGDPYGAEGYRLPTDAEWEYAAQWDDERIYPWGGEDPDCSRANFYHTDGFCVGWTSPVGCYPEAPAALGLYDMTGNVWEWCNDWYLCDLGTDPESDPPGPGSGYWRVLRSGSWGDPYNLRCSDRNLSPPDGSFGGSGFRAARTGTGSGVDDNAARSRLHLNINRPNPFSGLTQITYVVPTGSTATLVIYDAIGRFVRTLIAEQQAGEHTLSWNGANDAGHPVEAGAYFCRLTVGEESVSRRMLLVR